MEKVILYCTSLGLGTVWLGGTFQKGQFAKAIGLKEPEVLPVIVPVGYEGGKKTLIATIFGNHSGQRKPFSELFFECQSGVHLNHTTAGRYIEPKNIKNIC